MKSKKEVYPSIRCSCNASNECWHKLLLTAEEREYIFNGLKQMYPDFTEEELRKAIYGEPQKES